MPAMDAMFRLAPSGIDDSAARRSALLYDPARKLPEMPIILVMVGSYYMVRRHEGPSPRRRRHRGHDGVFPASRRSRRERDRSPAERRARNQLRQRRPNLGVARLAVGLARRAAPDDEVAGPRQCAAAVAHAARFEPVGLGSTLPRQLRAARRARQYR